MRAREPDSSGYIQRGGVNVYYEVFGDGSPTILFLPSWSIVHSRIWKAQIPYLARHFRVIAFDGRGNGKSDRPTEPEAYVRQEFAEDAVAVMDATDTAKAIVVGLSREGVDAIILAADFPERVEGAVLVCPVSPLGEPSTTRTYSWNDKLETTEGWAKFNRHYWLTNYVDFLRFFAGQIFTEAHSTKQIEDVVEWGSETSAETLVATMAASEPPSSSFS